MRQIKFRAWDEHNKRFIGPVSDFNVRCSNGDFQQNSSAGKIGGIFVEQYTELKDKNDIEGYENDICKYEYWVQTSVDPDHSGKIFSGIGKIVFIDGCFMIRDIKTKYTVPLHYPDLSFEVIGDIHLNPELLND